LLLVVEVVEAQLAAEVVLVVLELERVCL